MRPRAARSEPAPRQRAAAASRGRSSTSACDNRHTTEAGRRLAHHAFVALDCDDVLASVANRRAEGGGLLLRPAPDPRRNSLHESAPMFVIAGVDGRERSRDVIVLARRIAAMLEAQLLAVYVFPIGELAGYLQGGSGPEVRRLLAEAEDVAHARVRELASEMEVDEVRLRTASSAAAGLHSSAVEEDTQLIVLGSSERAGLERVFPGPTATRLLSGSPVAVAIAPVGYADRQPDEGAVGCGYDVSRNRATAPARRRRLSTSSATWLTPSARTRPPAVIAGPAVGAGRSAGSRRGGSTATRWECRCARGRRTRRRSRC